MANSTAASVDVAKEILRYLLRNPGAVDSLKEIARWRLMQEVIRRNVEETFEALEWLTSQGYVREENRAGAESVYQLNPQRRAAAASFVEDDAKDLK